MKWLPFFVLMVLMPATLAQDKIAQDKPVAPLKVLLLIHPLSGADYPISIEANVGQRFFKTLEQSSPQTRGFNSSGFNRIVGRVAAPNQGLYPVTLSFFDAVGPGGSIEDSIEVPVRLGEPYQRKLSGVVCYTMTLVQAKL